MITRDEADRLREHLLSLLGEDAHNTERLLERLKGVTVETGIGAHAALLLILTRLNFDEQEAQQHWQQILRHRTALSEGLGRDVGLRVALLDYFTNVNRSLSRPCLIDMELLRTQERSSPLDPLTGLANERSFKAAVQTELRRAKRYGHPVAVALFDCDDFAGLNERVGTFVADRVLREVAILLSNKVRDTDVASRPGEDELALVLPETDHAGALLVAERFRREVDVHFARRSAGGQRLGLTVSGGIACYPRDATAPELLVARAAQALYQAKAAGKNAVHVYEDERRRFLRFDLEPGRFEVEVLQPKEIGRAHPRNLSRNGIIFSSPEPLEVGEEIELRVADPRPGPGPGFRIRGRVVRLDELPLEGAGSRSDALFEDRYDIGVGFDPADAAGDRRLAEFLEGVRAEAGSART